jgi:low temperature requirement protein LtrA
MTERDQGLDDLQPAEVVRVSSLELFSDLVFVFAVTRSTTVRVNDPTWTGLSHVLLLFGVAYEARL